MQISAKLRRLENGHGHYCPGCKEYHVIPDSWTFDGNIESPTFNPSVAISGKQKIIKDGEWTGEWHRNEDGTPKDYRCHYHLHSGKLIYCSDSTHDLASQTVDLPNLPDWLMD